MLFGEPEVEWPKIIAPISSAAHNSILVWPQKWAKSEAAMWKSFNCKKGRHKTAAAAAIVVYHAMTAEWLRARWSNNDQGAIPFGFISVAQYFLPTLFGLVANFGWNATKTCGKIRDPYFYLIVGTQILELCTMGNSNQTRVLNQSAARFGGPKTAKLHPANDRRQRQREMKWGHLRRRWIWRHCVIRSRFRFAAGRSNWCMKHEITPTR